MKKTSKFFFFSETFFPHPRITYSTGNLNLKYWIRIFLKLVLLHFLMCVNSSGHTSVMAHVPELTSGNQKTMCRNLISPFMMWVLWVNQLTLDGRVNFILHLSGYTPSAESFHQPKRTHSDGLLICSFFFHFQILSIPHICQVIQAQEFGESRFSHISKILFYFETGFCVAQIGLEHSG